MAKKTPELVETYRGHRIWHRPWIVRRPYRCEVPRRGRDRERHADWKTMEHCRELIDKMIRAQTRYPLGVDQPAQIDCRLGECMFYSHGGECKNISPALTLNLNGRFVCWSHVSRDADQEAKYQFGHLDVNELAQIFILITSTGFPEDEEFARAIATEIKQRKEDHEHSQKGRA